MDIANLKQIYDISSSSINGKVPNYTLWRSCQYAQIKPKLNQVI